MNIIMSKSVLLTPKEFHVLNYCHFQKGIYIKDYEDGIEDELEVLKEIGAINSLEDVRKRWDYTYENVPYSVYKKGVECCLLYLNMLNYFSYEAYMEGEYFFKNDNELVNELLKYMEREGLISYSHGRKLIRLEDMNEKIL